MIKAPLPPNEAERLATLRGLNILDTPPEERFDRITRTAKRLFDVPIVTISLIDAERQWFKSCLGLPIRETARDISFCAHGLLCKDVLVVEDARTDSRFADNPLVTGEPWIRFYAGIPLAGLDGNRLGMLCVIDTRPRAVTNAEIHVLRDLAAWAESELCVIQALGQSVAVLKESAAEVQAILNSVIDGIITIDSQGAIRTVNNVAQTLFGVTRDEVAGRSIKTFISDDHHSVIESMLDSCVRENPNTTPRPGPREVDGLHKDGTTFPLECVITPMTLDHRHLLVFVARDIRERRAHIEMQEHQATHDVLTGLPNRILLHDRLQQAILRGRREKESAALLIMDLNGFKEINAALGHQNGDVLLYQFGLRVKRMLRASDTIARLGGDEFGVLLPNTDRDGAVVLTQKIQKALDLPFTLEGLSLDVGVSVGIAVYPEHGEDATTLLQRADVAMYVAKHADAGFSVYASDRDPHTPRRLALMGELRHAIESGQLFQLYQPIINLRTGTVTGVESLVRWQHPTLGLIPPDQFIMLSEQTGLIKPLTQWVLDKSLEQCHAWHEAGLELSMAVNLSVRNLQDPRLPEQIAEHLERRNVPARWLELEITEGTIMQDPSRAMAILSRLNEMGVRLSIDDFGTGYSSLGYLKKLPVEAIKVDKSFVIGMASDEDDAVIVRSTIDLGHNLGLKIIAEGVENRETLEKLTALGCDLAQGFYMSRPILPADLERWIAESPWGFKRALRTKGT